MIFAADFTARSSDYTLLPVWGDVTDAAGGRELEMTCSVLTSGPAVLELRPFKWVAALWQLNKSQQEAVLQMGPATEEEREKSVRQRFCYHPEQPKIKHKT